MGQSTNDVFPSAIHVAAYAEISEALLPALDGLAAAFGDRAKAFADVVRPVGRISGRRADDARAGVGGAAAVVLHGIARVKTTLPRLAELAVGGTALGTGINAPEGFGDRVTEAVGRMTGLLRPPKDRFRRCRIATPRSRRRARPRSRSA
jgi:fumarate hydratase class II